jgi:serine/threonine protein kinase
LDFGLAKCRPVDPGPAITQDDFVMGTPHFMSPEILQGKGADTPSDVYALGGVLYQALCGAPPFDYPDTHRVLLAHLNEPVEHIQDRMPIAVPEPLADVIMKCLDKDPDRRYGSAGELADALEECLVHISGSSRPPVVTESADAPTGPARTRAAENPELHMSNVLHAPTEKLSRDDAVPQRKDAGSQTEPDQGS